jgi:PIN domain nuclease of toxin-antitoxin system
MKLLLDTEVLCALLIHPERFSKESRTALDEASSGGKLCVSVASLLQLREARRTGIIENSDLEKVDQWMSQNQPLVLQIDTKVLASMSAAHEQEAVADRLILATARSEECRLATFRTWLDRNIEYLLCSFEESLP